ncbi:MAG: deoxyribose-phosphate aldolase [Polyangiales bacterium]
MRRDLARLIDHTLLRPDAIPPDFEQLCAEAAHYNLAAVCVNSTHVRRCRALLAKTGVKVASTVGFPLGAASVHAKVEETIQAVRDGADEIDMVCDIGALRASDEAAFLADVRGVVEAAAGRPVKVILETAMLDDIQKQRGAAWTKEAGAAFVKTSTGFGGGGATVHDVLLLRTVVGPEFGVKASGGIRDAGDADALLAAGATRLGTSAGVQIVTESTPDAEGA